MSSFSESVKNIVRRSLRECGAIAVGQDASAEQMANGVKVIYAIIEELFGEGIKFWKVDEFTKQLGSASEVLGDDAKNYTCIKAHVAENSNRPVSGANYLDYWEEAGTSGVAWVDGSKYFALSNFLISELNSEAEDIVYAFTRDSSEDDIPVRSVTRTEYASIVDKNDADEPIIFWVERRLEPNDTRVYVWPVPNDPDEYTFHAHCILKGSTPDNPNGKPDFPAHWINYFVYRGAADMGLEEGTPLDRIGLLRNLATGVKRKAERSDKKNVATYFSEAIY